MNDPQNSLQWKPRIGRLLADKSQTDEKRNSKYHKQVILPYLQTVLLPALGRERRGCGVRLIVDLNDRMAHHAFAPVLGTHSTIASHTTGTDGSRDGWLVSHSHKGNLSQAPIITICHSPESIEMTNEDQKPCWQAQRAECWTELAGSSGVDLVLEQVSIACSSWVLRCAELWSPLWLNSE